MRAMAMIWGMMRMTRDKMKSGRGGRDRTADLLFPKQARSRCATPRRGVYDYLRLHLWRTNGQLFGVGGKIAVFREKREE